MSDLIRRQDAIELIENESRKWGDEYGVSDVLCDLADLPSAQPEWKKGKWVEVKPVVSAVRYDRYECSECGKGVEWKRGMNFCPNCGAEMRKGEEE